MAITSLPAERRLGTVADDSRGRNTESAPMMAAVCGWRYRSVSRAYGRLRSEQIDSCRGLLNRAAGLVVGKWLLWLWEGLGTEGELA